jgi:hypothetical protein
MLSRVQFPGGLARLTFLTGRGREEDDMDHPYRTPGEDPDEDDFSELDDVDDRLRALHEAQTIWERLAYLKTMKMPCPECGGAGSIYAGSLGTSCPECLGARVVDHPAAEDLDIPDFADMRLKLSAAADARDQRLGLRAEDEMLLALPDPADLPTLEEIKGLKKKGHQLALQAPQAPQIQGEMREPPRPRLDAPDNSQLDSLQDGEERSFLSESSIGGEGLDDAYLDELERGED